MAKVLGDLKYPIRKYIDDDGKERSVWMKCGVVLETDKGIRAHLEAIPVDIWFQMYPKEDKPATKPVQQTSESDEPF